MFKVNAELIRSLMMKRGLKTITDLSHETRLNYTTCRKLVTGSGRFFLKVIAQAAQALGVEGEDLILKEELV